MAVTHSMAVEFGHHGILVNAVIPGPTMTAERIAAMQPIAMKGPFESAPADAPQTLTKQRELLQKGGLSEHLINSRSAAPAMRYFGMRRARGGAGGGFERAGR
jgi:NAD(P)-dependent dehydrogenase (short-subunit alcohol dehydrogenase family)